MISFNTTDIVSLPALWIRTKQFLLSTSSVQNRNRDYILSLRTLKKYLTCSLFKLLLRKYWIFSWLSTAADFKIWKCILNKCIWCNATADMLEKTGINFHDVKYFRRHFFFQWKVALKHDNIFKVIQTVEDIDLFTRDFKIIKKYTKFWRFFKYQIW